MEKKWTCIWLSLLIVSFVITVYQHLPLIEMVAPYLLGASLGILLMKYSNWLQNAKPNQKELALKLTTCLLGISILTLVGSIIGYTVDSIVGYNVLFVYGFMVCGLTIGIMTSIKFLWRK